ncbi:MAG TPA: M28 family peptidase [Vicinamibacteria bacterium]|nr:M28 family peptidase [Vicinamibacteria bacterium]
MSALLGLLLAASIDGDAALRHASALAALGPHPWGSPRDQAAAQYVAAQLREAGLDEIELQPFEREGVRGTNVVATLRAPGDEFVVVGAHHDTAPAAPGAYDDGGGVGILIELARALARDGRRARTVVFASFDGEESWSAGKGPTAGSRAFVERLGPRGRSMVAAFAIEMSGWSGGAPVLHPIAYADPREPGRAVIAPAWLVRAALEGARESGSALGVGDPYLSWLYQPAVRTFRVRLYGDDLSFLQGGHPALFASDSSFSAFYPDYHKASDTADKLDAAALERMGRGVLGLAQALQRVPRGPAEEPHWFAAFGRVFGWGWLAGVGAASLLPGLWRGARAGGPAVGLRIVQSLLAGVLLWRHPVPALWLLIVPQGLLPWRRAWWAVLLALAPALGLLAIGASAWWRGAVSGVWLAPWEILVAALALALAFLGLGAGGGRSGGRRPSGRKRR